MYTPCYTSILKISIKISKDLGMSKKHRNKWWHLSSYFDPLHSSRITSPKSRGVHSVLPVCHFAVVLLTHTNTLDRSHHFEPGTFINRRHYPDVWWIETCTYYDTWCCRNKCNNTKLWNGKPRVPVLWMILYSWLSACFSFSMCMPIVLHVHDQHTFN